MKSSKSLFDQLEVVAISPILSQPHWLKEWNALWITLVKIPPKRLIVVAAVFLLVLYIEYLYLFLIYIRV